jgi:fructose-1,6-bisphosphatase/inositol monophosphatase family enzyme
MEMNLERKAEHLTELQERVAEIHVNPEKFGVSSEILLKGEKDYTTAVDRKVEKILKPQLKRLVRGSGFLGEETESSGLNSRYIWIVDPTDGSAVFSTGGLDYTNSISLIDKAANKGKGGVILGSVYQSATGKQFLMIGNKLIVKEFIETIETGEELITRMPVPSKSRGFPEFLGCSFGTSKYYPQNPGVEDKLKNVFKKELHPVNGREYGRINARPASGSSALFCCNIADGKNHFAMLFYQAAWDLAVGAVFAQRAGCPVVLFDNAGNLINQDLETSIANCDKNTLINVGVFGSEFIKKDILNKFYEKKVA